MTVHLPAQWLPEPQLLDSLDTAALVVGTDGTVRHANRAATMAYAGPVAGLVGRPLTDLFADGDREALDAVLHQVLGGDPWQGRVELPRADGSTHDAEVSCTPLRDLGGVQGVLCVIIDFSPEGQRLRDARLLGGRLAMLARVTGELARAEDLEAVSRIITSHSADAVGATIASLVLREGDDRLQMIALRGGEDGEAEQWASFPIDAPTPAGDVVRTGAPVLMIGAEAIEQRYPDMTRRGERSLLCLPLGATNRTVGAITLSFPGVRMIDAPELEFLEILADSCAQALERIDAQTAATVSNDRLAFLADASAELSGSLDYGLTLAKVAQLVVPTFADWCAIDVVEDGRLHRVAVAHVDPEKVQLARSLEERYPSKPDAPRGAWHVLRTATSELIPEITDEMLVAGARNEEHLRIVLDLRLRSAIVVPLIAHGRVLGVMSWVTAESDRRYSKDDLGFAEDVARRAAVAIDNAELHSETLAAAVRLQQAVLPDTMPEIPGWDVASFYDPSGRTDVGGDFYDAITLVDGRLVLFVGDVMGRGVEAAAAMAQMRAAVRAYTAIDPDPASVLGKLDRMFAQFPTEQLVTLVYLVIDPARDELVVANAGHPAPVLLRADRSTLQLPDADGCPLGVLVQDRVATTVPMRNGDTVLLFTDGLIERRDEDIDIGQKRVLHALPMLADPDLDAALGRLVVSLREPALDDDVAAVGARRTR